MPVMGDDTLLVQFLYEKNFAYSIFKGVVPGTATDAFLHISLAAKFIAFWQNILQNFLVTVTVIAF